MAKKERSKGQGSGNKPLIIAIVGIVVALLVFLVLMGVLLMNVLDRFSEDDSSTGQLSTYTYSIKQRSDLQNSYTGSGVNAYDLYGEEGASELEGDTTLPSVTSNYGTDSEFVYGTIKGNTYTSKFSGITFDAPSGWTLKGATKSTVTPTTVLDLDATSSSGTMSVKLQYFSLSGGNYTSTNQVLKALKAQVGDDTEIESKSKKIAGNNFTGFAFDGLSGTDTARSEVLVTQVSGYALVLQIVAPTQSDIDNILKNFS